MFDGLFWWSFTRVAWKWKHRVFYAWRFLARLRRMTNAFNYKQNVFYILNFGINLLVFYCEWLRYSLSIKQLDYELKISIAC